jgi:hypothetical protein
MADCKDALEIFGNKYQRCEFRFQDGTVCIAGRKTHDQHWNEKGTRQPGSFTDSILKRNPQNDPLLLIQKDFVKYYEKACNNQSGPSLPTPMKFRETRENVFRDFDAIWRRISSNKTCFTCLQVVPDHVMPCGHVYCSLCVQEFGQQSEWYERAWVMSGCVLCRARFLESPQLIRLKPRCAGVRILSLDGGGIRGIMEIALLEKLINKVNLNHTNPVPELFDLVIGTSTGECCVTCTDIN